MNAQQVLAYFHKEYPGKTILSLPEDNPTEIICEAEPSSDHPARSVAIAAIKSSEPHYHKASTEIYEIIAGQLDLYVDDQLIQLSKGDSYTIKPGQIHYAKGDFTLVKTTSTPGWVFEDHILTSRIVIVNDQDEIIGHKERGTLAKEDIYRVSALWVTNSGGDILLAQRKFTKKQDPGKWGPAVAGTVDEGETYDDNIIKEAEEEIGLANIKPTLGPKRRVSGEYNYFCQWYTLIVDKPAEGFIIQDEEVEQVKWLTRKELERELQEHPASYIAGMQWNMDNLTKDLKQVFEAMPNSPNLRGDIIEESLADKSTLETVSIISTRIEPVTPEHKTPWLKQWTLHTIEVSEGEAAATAERLSHAIETRNHNWYIDFKNDTTHYVIFPDKVFKLDRSQPEQYKPVVSYGVKLGVPRYQLDFSPEIKYWECPADIMPL